MGKKNIQLDEKYNFQNVFWIKLVYSILLITLPYSISYPLKNHCIELPSEPLMLILVVLLIPIFWKTRFQQKEFWKSPLIVCSFLWIGWMAVSSFWSVEPLVSFKFTLIAFVHWLLFGYGLCVLQLNPQKSIERWFNFYTIPLLGILFFAWKNHAQYDFRMDASVLVARPFYFDHAILSVSLLLLVGIYFSKIILFFREKKSNFFIDIQSILYAFIVLLLLVGVYLSFSRAAWVSIILASFIIVGIVLFKFNFKLMLSISIGGIILLGILTPLLIDKIQQNKIESKKGNWQQQMSSIGNITTDVSNLERLNRYSCALRMFQDRPIIGFGAGTFPTAFLPYQRKEEMTRISVTTVGTQRKGKGGSTHSEYLRALSEMGFIGGLLFLSLLLMSLKSGIQVFWNGNSSQQILALGLLFGLLTFFIHGLFNNFFHQGKIAILIWSSMAILTNLDRRINIQQDK